MYKNAPSARIRPMSYYEKSMLAKSWVPQQNQSVIALNGQSSACEGNSAVNQTLSQQPSQTIPVKGEYLKRQELTTGGSQNGPLRSEELAGAALQTGLPEIRVDQTFSSIIEEQQAKDSLFLNKTQLQNNIFIQQEIQLLQNKVNQQLSSVLLMQQHNDFTKDRDNQVLVQKLELTIKNQESQIKNLRQIMEEQKAQIKQLNLDLQKSQATLDSKLLCDPGPDILQYNIDNHPKYKTLQNDFMKVHDENLKLRELIKHKYGGTDTSETLALLNTVQEFARQRGRRQQIKDMSEANQYLKELFLQLAP